MPYTIKAETVINGNIQAIWNVVSDVNNWPAWDPHEEDARLDGSFTAGTKGWSKPKGGPAADWIITETIPYKKWASESPMPGGKIAGINLFEPLGDNQVRCKRIITITGPLIPLFWLYFGRIIRRDMFATWKALENEVKSTKGN